MFIASAWVFEDEWRLIKAEGPTVEEAIKRWWGEKEIRKKEAFLEGLQKAFYFLNPRVEKVE